MTKYITIESKTNESKYNLKWMNQNGIKHEGIKIESKLNQPTIQSQMKGSNYKL